MRSLPGVPVSTSLPFVATARMVVVAVALSSEGWASGRGELTDAVSTSFPCGGTLTRRVIVAVEPFASVPRAQVIVLAPVHVPCELERASSETPDGRMSVTVGCVASPAGPGDGPVVVEGRTARLLPATGPSL